MAVDIKSLEEETIEKARQAQQEADEAVSKEEEAFKTKIEPLTRQRNEAKAFLDRLQAKGATSNATGGRRRGRRRKGEPTRAEQFIEVVKSNPGESTSEYARMMDMHPNYLYRIVQEVEKEGLIRKENHKLYVTDKVPA